eukprot:scpid102494/ scgid3799/ Major facilitator superfamily domain-containing protein 9
MDSTDSLRSSGALRIIYAMHAIGFLDLLGVSLIIPLVTHHARSLGASPSTLGAMGSLYGALQLFTGPLVGQFSDIYGRHSVLLVVLVGAMVAYFIAGISTMLWVLIVARVLAGELFPNTCLAMANAVTHGMSWLGCGSLTYASAPA